ncbi:MAG: ATP-binding protein [Oscillospiraceae bacterium]|nr:ATP-binding protein [Oscillospiraceae bacterium]
MSLDGKLLRRAKDRLDRRRADRERKLQERRNLAYARDPYIARLDSQLRQTVIDAIGAALRKGEDPVEAVEAIKEKNLSLQEERALRLSSAGLPADYLSEDYFCPKCRDTGYNGTSLCSCLMDLYRQEQVRELSVLLKLGQETFDTFRLDYYSDIPDPKTHYSDRAAMSKVFDLCCDWAHCFSDRSPNLFLYGATGLGKTFLSTSIAKVVAEKGFSVVYDTAASVFSKYETEKFSRSPEEIDAARREIKRLHDCDLLIIDDLGTEMASSLITGALYTLLNDRLRTGKKMIINSNLTIPELGTRYSAAIMSRLQGEFLPVAFRGTDIRLKKQKL